MHYVKRVSVYTLRKIEKRTMFLVALSQCYQIVQIPGCSNVSETLSNNL